MSKKIVPIIAVLVIAVCVVGSCYCAIGNKDSDSGNSGSVNPPADLRGYGDDSALKEGVQLWYSTVYSEERYVNKTIVIEDVFESGDLEIERTVENSRIVMFMMMTPFDEYLGFDIRYAPPAGVTVEHDDTTHTISGSFQRTDGNWTYTYTMDLVLMTSLPDLSDSGNTLLSAAGTFEKTGEHKLPGRPVDTTFSMSGNDAITGLTDFLVKDTTTDEVVAEPTFAKMFELVLPHEAPYDKSELESFPGTYIEDTGETQTIQNAVCKKLTASNGGTADGIAYVYNDLVVSFEGIWNGSSTQFTVTMICP